jgi:hypothetical protein
VDFWNDNQNSQSDYTKKKEKTRKNCQKWKRTHYIDTTEIQRIVRDYYEQLLPTNWIPRRNE